MSAYERAALHLGPAFIPPLPDEPCSCARPAIVAIIDEIARRTKIRHPRAGCRCPMPTIDESPEDDGPVVVCRACARPVIEGIVEMDRRYDDTLAAT